MAPDAVLIVVGDHTPAGALGRVERRYVGDSDGRTSARPRRRGRRGGCRLGARAHVPGRGRAACSPARGPIAPVREGGSRPRAPCERASRPRATRHRGGHRGVDRFRELSGDAERTAHARTSGSRPRSCVDRGAAPQHPVVAVSPPTRTPAHGPSRNEGEPGDRRGPNRGESIEVMVVHDDQGGNQGNDDQGGNQGNDDQGGNQGNDDQGGNQGNDDQGGDEGNDDQGEERGQRRSGRGRGQRRSGRGTRANDDQGEDEGGR